VLVGIADLVDVPKELISKIPGLIKIVDLSLLSVDALLRIMELQENSACNRGQDRNHDQHFDEREPALPIFCYEEVLSHIYVPCPTKVLMVTIGPKALPDVDPVLTNFNLAETVNILV